MYLYASVSGGWGVYIYIYASVSEGGVYLMICTSVSVGEACIYMYILICICTCIYFNMYMYIRKYAHTRVGKKLVFVVPKWVSVCVGWYGVERVISHTNHWDW